MKWISFLKVTCKELLLNNFFPSYFRNGSILIECLVPDFSGREEQIENIVKSDLDVFAHNIETVEKLTPYVRDKRAKYRQSLSVLKTAKTLNPDLLTKSSIMLGLGETDDEVLQTMRDLQSVGVDCVTLGQYMQPTKKHLKVRGTSFYFAAVVLTMRMTKKHFFFCFRLLNMLRRRNSSTGKMWEMN